MIRFGFGETRQRLLFSPGNEVFKTNRHHGGTDIHDRHHTSGCPPVSRPARTKSDSKQSGHGGTADRPPPLPQRIPAWPKPHSNMISMLMQGGNWHRTHG